VRNQGSCGSCWAFTSIATIESLLLKNLGGAANAYDLSEQQLIDCTTSVGNAGCNGGWPSSATRAVKGGVMTESSYPYAASNGYCKYDAGKAPYSFTGVTEITNTKSALLSALKSNGPIAVSVYAGQEWQNYAGGILSCAPTTSLNHAVTLVGYNAEQDYYIIKNSWGTWWGENGYVRLSGTRDCGLMVAKSSVPY